MTKQAKGTYHLVSLGCPKPGGFRINVPAVESAWIGRFQYPRKSEYLIVNTCGFDCSPPGSHHNTPKSGQ